MGAFLHPHVKGHADEYAKFDLNGDGLIDPQEVRTVYGNTLSEEDLHDFWSSVDPKGRGVFTLEEYVDFVVRQGSVGSQQDS
jgi:Ca2+-binding EF-hand superfamily protein